MIAITGNGTFDTFTPPVNYGDSILRLTPGAGTMSVTSFFTPLNELLLDDEDLDMGSGGNLLLPDQPGPNTHLMVGIGKYGNIYLVNRDSMGGFNATTDMMVQELDGAVGPMFGTPAYWQGMVPNVGLQNMIYTVASYDVPKMYVIANGLIQYPCSVSGAELPFWIPGSIARYLGQRHDRRNHVGDRQYGMAVRWYRDSLCLRRYQPEQRAI